MFAHAGCQTVVRGVLRCVGGRELCMWSCERSSGAVCPRELCGSRCVCVCGARVYMFYYISRARRGAGCGWSLSLSVLSSRHLSDADGMSEEPHRNGWTDVRHLERDHRTTPPSYDTLSLADSLGPRRTTPHRRTTLGAVVRHHRRTSYDTSRCRTTDHPFL